MGSAAVDAAGAGRPKRRRTSKSRDVHHPSADSTRTSNLYEDELLPEPVGEASAGRERERARGGSDDALVGAAAEAALDAALAADEAGGGGAGGRRGGAARSIADVYEGLPAGGGAANLSAAVAPGGNDNGNDMSLPYHLQTSGWNKLMESVQHLPREGAPQPWQPPATDAPPAAPPAKVSEPPAKVSEPPAKVSAEVLLAAAAAGIEIDDEKHGAVPKSGGGAGGLGGRSKCVKGSRLAPEPADSQDSYPNLGKAPKDLKINVRSTSPQSRPPWFCDTS
jgi:hypothetical protein